MSKRYAYQTLEDRDINNVESCGPFLCNYKNAWLGRGYYFWDSFVEIAHWWGKEVAYCRCNYIICESTYILDENKCFNLVDNPKHLHEFNEVKNILIEQNLFTYNNTTVARIIEYIKNVLKVFNYEAIRVYGINSVSYKSIYSNRTNFIFKEGKSTIQYLDSSPAIQICFYEKKSLNREGFKIIYPPEYSDDYLV